MPCEASTNLSFSIHLEYPKIDQPAPCQLMRRYETFSQLRMVLVLAATLALFCNQAYAGRIFYESFESPENATGATDPVGWTEGGGHPSYRRAANESGQNWSTPYGEQGMSTYTSGIGLKSLGYLAETAGEYVLKFNVTSANPKAEYRAELSTQEEIFGNLQPPVTVAFTAGDSDGSKDMSFTGELRWRYEYDPAVNFLPTLLQIRLMHDPDYSTWRSAPIWDNVSVDFIPDVDTEGPTLVDIADDRNGGTVVGTGSLVTYTVTFNEPMEASTVTATDFENAGSSTATITSVTTTADDAVFLVGVTPTGGGTLRLGIVNGTDLKDTVGNSMDDFSAIQDNVTFTVEAGTPILQPIDIVDDRGGSSAAENTLVTYTLTFNKDMDDSTVQVADFGNAGTAPITIGTITETSPGVFTVEVTPTNSGTLQFRINPGIDIRAADGGQLNTSSEIADDTTIIVDSDPPTLTDIIDDAGGSPVAVGALLTYDVFFSEDMDASTVDASDFGNAVTTGNATYTIDSVEEASPGVFRLELTTTGPGSIQLQINSGAALADVLGNTLVTTSAILDDATITVGTDPYESWSGGELFDDDLNQDGMANGMAWLLGATGPNVNTAGIQPTISADDADYVIYYYRRSDEAFAAGAVAKVQYSQNLGGWDDASIGNVSQQGALVIVNVHDDLIDTGIDQVEVKIHRDLITGDHFFLKLDVTLP